MQARIAMVNTALTAAGMWALAIPGVGLLSLFVFICSFIPIAGCFISTVPVAFVALTEYGFLKVGSRPYSISYMLDSIYAFGIGFWQASYPARRSATSIQGGMYAETSITSPGHTVARKCSRIFCLTTAVR